MVKFKYQNYPKYNYCQKEHSCQSVFWIVFKLTHVGLN
jgi:hypothetical protein